MAPRAIWKGAVGFGMVVIPIRLYPATQSKDIAFSMLHGTCHSRIRQKRFCSYHEVEVPQDEIVKGYQFAKDEFVVMEPSDFDDLPVPSKHTIEITRFVDLAAIDPMYFERGYVLEPEPVGQKPFYLLKQALETTKRVAIAKVSLRQKEHLCCVRPYGNAIAMSTMFYADEIRPIDELDMPEDDSLVSEQEVAMATTLIDQLTGPFDLSEHRDGYRWELERVIEAKLSGVEPVTGAPAPAKGKVVDLMEALKASIEATKSEAVSSRSPAGSKKAAGARKSRKKAAAR
jgi:DNA end-binding protein Ku